MFIDETRIEVIAGAGGNGCFAYERLKFRPYGPPAGGNGGKGGDVYFCADFHLLTLQDAAYHKKYQAVRGDHGSGSNKFGRKAGDVVIPVPIGTLIYDGESGILLHDCIQENKPILIARGGRGGRGNAAMRTRKNPNPEFAEEGKPGEIKKLRLVLKVLADVGLVGRPNAGKSTFLSTISRAHPKIADYPFTTTAPHLGIIKSADGYQSFVVADIPGLIEGSHTGKGLGIRFLRHIERTKILAIMVEATSEDPQADADVLLAELAAYSPLLAQKPCCFILTKADIFHVDEKPSLPPKWFVMSSLSKVGVTDVLREFERLIIAERGKVIENTAVFDFDSISFVKNAGKDEDIEEKEKEKEKEQEQEQEQEIE